MRAVKHVVACAIAAACLRTGAKGRKFKENEKMRKRRYPT